MRLIFLRLVLAFSFILAGMHISESAHADTGADHGLHHDHHASAGDDASGQDGDTSDLGGEVMHHHHCSMGLDIAPSCELAAMPLGGSLLLLANSAVLRSRATEPPLQPPLA